MLKPYVGPLDHWRPTGHCNIHPHLGESLDGSSLPCIAVRSTQRSDFSTVEIGIRLDAVLPNITKAAKAEGYRVILLNAWEEGNAHVEGTLRMVPGDGFDTLEISRTIGSPPVQFSSVRAERGNFRLNEEELLRTELVMDYHQSESVMGEVLDRDFAQVRIPHDWRMYSAARDCSAYYLFLTFEKDIEK